MRNDLILSEVRRGRTYEDIGQEFGVSRQRIHQLAKGAGIDRPTMRRSKPKECHLCGLLYRGGWMEHSRTDDHQAVLFWSKVDKSGDCWVWTRARHPSGYGSLGAGHYAHRRSYELTYGPVPDGLWVLHHCDNRPCVRPDHLYAGTALENAHDRDTRTTRKPS